MPPLHRLRVPPHHVVKDDRLLGLPCLHLGAGGVVAGGGGGWVHNDDLSQGGGGGLWRVCVCMCGCEG